MNDDGNFRNGGNFRIDRNVDNAKNFRTTIKCYNFSETEAIAYLEISGMVVMSTGRRYCTSVLVLLIAGT